jgi:hypothetical protein
MSSIALSLARGLLARQSAALPPPPSPGLAGSPWRVLGPPAMVELRRPRARSVRRLPPGSSVCLVTDTPLARWRLRRLARRTGLVVERELVAVPSTRAPLVLIDDLEGPIDRFWQSTATVPPGMARAALAAHLALVVARRMPWTWTGSLAPGRVVIGRLP